MCDFIYARLLITIIALNKIGVRILKSDFKIMHTLKKRLYDRITHHTDFNLLFDPSVFKQDQIVDNYDLLFKFLEAMIIVFPDSPAAKIRKYFKKKHRQFFKLNEESVTPNVNIRSSLETIHL